MPNWLIVPTEDEKWLCRLENCDEEHARSVWAQLCTEPAVPDGLSLVEEGVEHEPEPEPEPEPFVYVEVPDFVQPRKRFRFWRK